MPATRGRGNSLPTIDEIKGLYGTESNTIRDYYKIATRCHEYVVTNSTSQMIASGYDLRIGATDIDVRPINKTLFIWDSTEFKTESKTIDFISSPAKITPTESNRLKYRSILYTIQKSIEAYLDLKVDAQQARKVVGEVFQGFVAQIFKTRRCTISGGGVSFKIPTPLIGDDPEAVQEENKVKLSFDLVVRKIGIEHSSDFQANDIICGVKTTTKDRGNMFWVDRYLYHQTQEAEPKFIAVCLNDVQRKKDRSRVTTGVSFTFLPGHFNLYEHVFGQLDGFYFIDPPSKFVEVSSGRDNLGTIDHLMFDHLPTWHR